MNGKLYIITVKGQREMFNKKEKISFEINKIERFNDDRAEAVTKALMDDYIQKHKHVLKKLEVVKMATSDALREMESIKKIFNHDQLTSMIEEYEESWQRNIQSFLKAGLTDKDLLEVEGIIARVPEFIKEKYEERMAKEPAFEAILSDEDRECIFKIIKKTSGEFEAAWSEVKAYKMEYDSDVVRLN